MTTPYDVPLGDGAGSYAFRLLPDDHFDEGASTVAVDAAASGRAVLVSYTWVHPVDGPQTGTLLLGVPGEDGAVSAAWVDSWHQRDVVALTGTGTADRGGGRLRVRARLDVGDRGGGRRREPDVGHAQRGARG